MGMTKEARVVLGGEAVESFGQGMLEFVEGASGCLTQVGFEFGECQFDGVEIGAVRRQVTHAGSLGRDEFSDALHFMGGEVVEDDDVALLEFGTENMPQIGGEDLGVERSLDQERSLDTFRTQGGDEGGALPVAVGDGPDAAMAHRATPIESSHLGVESGFVDKDQTLAVPLGLVRSPPGAGRFDIRPILLGGARRFFYSSSRGGRVGARGR